jgi:hypothetical protein
MAYQPQFDGTSAAPKTIVPDPTLLVPKKKKGGELIALNVFTDWEVYTGHGVFNVLYQNPNMNINSNVMISMCEMTSDDAPFHGDCLMTALAVAPFNNGCWTRVVVPWDSALRFQVMFLWANP